VIFLESDRGGSRFLVNLRSSRRSHFTIPARDVDAPIQKSNLASTAESRLSLRFRRTRGCACVRNTRKRDVERDPVTSTV